MHENCLNVKNHQRVEKCHFQLFVFLMNHSNIVDILVKINVLLTECGPGMMEYCTVENGPG